MNIKTSTYGGMSHLLSEGFSPVSLNPPRSDWESGSSERVQAAFNIQLAYTARLHEAASLGDISAKRNVQDLLLGRKEFIGNRKAYRVLQEAYVHSTKDFVNMTAAVANRRLFSLWNRGNEATCWRDYVHVADDRDHCDEMGALSVVPVEAGSTSGNPLVEGGTFTYWRFGERLKGKYCVHMYADGFAWTWKLSKCDKYGGLSDILPFMIRIQRERKETFAAQLHTDKKGPHPAVYNLTYKNVLPGNPRFSLKALKAAFRYMAKQEDDDGELIDVDGREWQLVVGSYDLKEEVMEILDTKEIRVTGQDDQGNNVEEIRKPKIPEVTVCYNRRIRKVATASHPNGGTYADHSWWLVPAPIEGDKNAFEMSHLRGFRAPRLFRKLGNTAAINGRMPIQELGDFDTMDQLMKAVQSYGGGAMYPEWTFASNGTGQ